MPGVPGSPVFVTEGSDAGAQIGAPARRGAAGGSPVILAPGQTAHAQLAVVVAGNFPSSRGHMVTAPWMKVFPPDRYTATYLTYGGPTCSLASQPTMDVGAMTPGA